MNTRNCFISQQLSQCGFSLAVFCRSCEMWWLCGLAAVKKTFIPSVSYRRMKSEQQGTIETAKLYSGTVWFMGPNPNFPFTFGWGCWCTIEDAVQSNILMWLKKDINTYCKESMGHLKYRMWAARIMSYDGSSDDPHWKSVPDGTEWTLSTAVGVCGLNSLSAPPPATQHVLNGESLSQDSTALNWLVGLGSAFFKEGKMQMSGIWFDYMVRVRGSITLVSQGKSRLPRWSSNLAEVGVLLCCISVFSTHVAAGSGDLYMHNWLLTVNIKLASSSKQ